jgi:hypothetical protein
MVRACRILSNRWLRAGAIAAAAGVSLVNINRVPAAAPLPVLLGLVPWAAGKYLLCPLRWHALTESGRGRWWHIRAYAEAELLGLLSPAHAGADLWRVHRLHQAGMGRPPAVAEVALDRLVGAVGLAAAVAVTGVTLPPRVLLALGGVVAGALVLAGLVRVRRPDLFAQRPLPRPRILVRGLLLSLCYQATILGLLAGAVTAVGHPVHPLRLVAVFGASQVAGIIPGVNGASPRDGALAVGLVSLGLPWASALAAVALVAMLAWPPAVLLGGGSLAARRLAARHRAARGPAARRLAGRRPAARGGAAHRLPTRQPAVQVPPPVGSPVLR